MPLWDARDVQRPALPMQLVLWEVGVRFEPHEIGQHVVPPPAGIAEVPPEVIILALTADDDETVNGTRSAERAAARPIDAPVVHVRIWLGLEPPVEPRMPHSLAVSDRQMDPEAAVLWARLENRDPAARVG